MKKVEEVVTDEQLNTAWANANFGSISKRDVVKGELLKCASGYYTGFTAKKILMELGLVYSSKWQLTEKGKEYLFAAYSNGVSVDWSKLEKIAAPEKWIEMYQDYQNILTQQDVAGFWQEQFHLANKERNELKTLSRQWTDDTIGTSQKQKP